jgi:hypothetical protein
MGSHRTLVCPRRCGHALFATASICAIAFLIVLMRWVICVVAPRVFFEGIPIWYMLGEFQSKTGYSLDNCVSLQHAQVWEGAGLLFHGVSVTLLLIVASYLVLDHRRCRFAGPQKEYKPHQRAPTTHMDASSSSCM